MYLRETILSNTATPKYYGYFRQAVLSGEIPVSREIALEMGRIDNLIADPAFYYDSRPVEAFIRFCEAELVKTDGSSLTMLDSFKLWSEQLFGWYYISLENVYVKTDDFEGFIEKPVFKRLIKKQYLIVARGGAKSMYASFIQAYFLTVDGETTHQITAAPTMKQAEEVLGPIRTAIVRSPGPLLRFLSTNKTPASGAARSLLASTKKGIENFLTGSLLEIRPMSITKLQGLRPKISTLDEWLSGDIREDVVGAVEQGASKLNDYIIIAISSEGTIRNGAGDSVKLELAKILNGEYEDPHTSIFHYKLDSVEEVGDPHMWVKAQPNLGITVSYETYHRDVLRAENAPSTRNDILAKRFGLPMEGYTYYFTYEETIPHKHRSYTDMDCAMGADLSQGDDFCSFLFMFPMRGGAKGIKTVNFITERTFDLLQPAARFKYEEFISEGSLVIIPGTELNIEAVFDVLVEIIDNRRYIVQTMGYDPYNAETFVTLYKQTYGPYGIEVVRQGARTESVPLGLIKQLSEDRLLWFDDKIFSYAMGNSMVMEDTNGNRKLFKRRYENKIDPVAALIDAYVAYTRHPELFG